MKQPYNHGPLTVTLPLRYGYYHGQKGPDSHIQAELEQAIAIGLHLNDPVHRYA
jgi:hypothetical protein